MAEPNPLREMRKAKRWTLDEASQATGLSKAALSRIERGEREPSASTLYKIARGFGYDEFAHWLEEWVR